MQNFLWSKHKADFKSRSVEWDYNSLNKISTNVTEELKIAVKKNIPLIYLKRRLNSINEVYKTLKYLVQQMMFKNISVDPLNL